MKMRDLEARTSVNRETIRVYFRHGLLPAPNRPARNVADYGEEHVEAILAVRKLQHTMGLTLQQISSVLKGNSVNRPVTALAFNHLETLVRSRVGEENGLILLNSLIEQNPKARDDAKAMHDIGTIELISTEEGLALSITDAGLLNIWGRMRKVGFDEEHGFPPGILDYYLEAAEFVAGKEAQIFMEKIEGRITEEDAAAMLEIALPSMLTYFGIIRQKLFLRNLREITAGRASAINAKKLPKSKKG